MAMHEPASSGFWGEIPLSTPNCRIVRVPIPSLCTDVGTEIRTSSASKAWPKKTSKEDYYQGSATCCFVIVCVDSKPASASNGYP